MPFVRLLLVVLVVGMAEARAQGAMPSISAAELQEARAACEQLGRSPNAPISVEACRAMLDMGAQFDAAANDSAARRPDDDRMSCAAIFAELQTVAGAGISDVNRARSQAVVTSGTAMANRQAAELNAFIIESYALGAVAGIVGAFTPNFVGAALSAAWQAQAVGLGMKQAAEQVPLRNEMSATMLANVGELGASMKDNPRFGRLVALAAMKECEAPGAVK
ncbi:MAG: hypothetical protein ABI593_02555 [Betaproteobacteria bacterium]